MALRLGDFIIRGELNNTKHYSTFGRFELVGYESPIMFELTGNCHPDLQGKRIYFEAVPPPAKPAEKPPRVAGHLIGVTGDMTAASWVRTFECSVEEFIRRCKLGEAPPTTWKRRLYLEFYCQHGRTVIELGGPVLEYDAGSGDHEDWRPLPEATPMPGPDDERRMAEQAESSGPEIAIVHQSGEIEQIDAREYLEQAAAGEEAFNLQRQFDAKAAAVDRVIRGEEAEEDLSEVIAETELMDDLMANEDGEPLLSVLQNGRRLPRPDDIPEDKIEPLMKSLLADLALHGVGLHVCKHFSLRDTYRLLVERSRDEWRYHPELAGTGWVQNFMTDEYCPQCEAEALRDNEEFDDNPEE